MRSRSDCADVSLYATVKTARIHPPHLELCPGWHQGKMRLTADSTWSNRGHVLAPIEVEPDFRAAAAGIRTEAAQSRNGAKHFSVGLVTWISICWAGRSPASILMRMLG